MELANNRSTLGKPTSVWMDTAPKTNYPALHKDMETDIVIIGGGIAGLMSAYFLKKAGHKVILVESGKIASGTTGFTTAKVTSAHGLVYKYLIDHFGKEKAQIYADANQEALIKIADLVKELNIDCDFQKMPAYTYAPSVDQNKKIEDEVIAAQSLGLPASLIECAPLPYKTASAVCFSDQAQFHPRKFLLKIASEINGDGSYIFEKTKVLDIEETQNCTVETDRGILTSKKVVIATNLPIIDPDNFFTKITSRQSFTIGAKIDGALPLGVFYGPEANHNFHSLRTQPLDEHESILIVGGELHKNGESINQENQYKSLVEWTKSNFALNAVKYHWTTSDSESPDHVPIIGRLSMNSKNIFVATGFTGWGMTHSVVAGIILADEIRGIHHPWSELYSPKRFPAFVAPQKDKNTQISNNTEQEKKMADLEKIKNGDAMILNLDGRKTAIYKDDEGKIHALSASCTHMGCIVEWNKKAKRWDCPCHGSSFNFDGEVIHGPATKKLPKVEL